MSSLESRLERMVDKQFLYRTNPCKVVNWCIEDDKVILFTNKGKIDLVNADELKEFLPIDSTPTERPDNQALAGRTNGNGSTSLQVIPSNSEFLSSLSTTIKENIENVKNDRSYIAQASAINDSINTLINLAKLELQVLKLKMK